MSMSLLFVLVIASAPSTPTKGTLAVRDLHDSYWYETFVTAVRGDFND